jgi:hypothetical protein
MTGIGNKIRNVLLTPFAFATLGCLVLAGWLLWTGGIFDDAMAAKVRTSSVYAAPGVNLDTSAAEKIIGNRRLVVIMLEPGADLGATCDKVKRAAAGTLVLLITSDAYNLDTFGCGQFSGDDDKDFGQAMVAESTIGIGIDDFVDRPLDAIKVVAVNYDQLVKAGIIPNDARTISPSLPRYLAAIAAVVAVLAGAALLYAASRRAGRLTATRRARRDEATDSRTVLSAAAAVVAQQIIDLDPVYAASVKPASTGKARRRGAATGFGGRSFASEYRQLTSNYTSLLDDVAAADRRDETDFSPFTERAEALAAKFRALMA